MATAIQLSWEIPEETKITKSYYSEVCEEIATYGIENAGIKELLAIIIGPKATVEICNTLALTHPNRLMAMSQKEFITLGLSPSVATKFEAIFKLYKALNQSRAEQHINSPRDAAQALSFIANEEQEHLVVITLNTKNKVTKKHIVTKGTINSSIVHPREILKVAIRESANSFIIGHNHPSGDCTPSKEDIEMSRRLFEASKLVGIEMLDSIIVSFRGYMSMKEMGIF